MPISLTKAAPSFPVRYATPVTFTYVGTPPVVVSQVSKLRDHLFSSAKTDQVKACEFWRDPPGTFYPYGQGVECVQRHVRHDASGFRDGVQHVFQNYKAQNQIAYADALVEPLIAMIMAEALIAEPEARQIVNEDYARTFGKAPSKPPQTGFAPIDPSRQAMQVGPTASSSSSVPPVDPTMFGPEVPVETKDEFPWLLVGAGVLAVAGGVFFLMRRKRQ